MEPLKPDMMNIHQRITHLQDRILALELEVSLLGILVENPKGGADPL